LAIAMHLNPRIGWAHVLQVNGWIGGPDAHGGYWFVEALVQILLVVTAVLAIPAVQRLERRSPVALPSAALAAGLLVRFDVVSLPTVEPHDIRPHDIFWLFALGWAAAVARTARGRVVLSAVLLVALPGYFGEPQREVLIAVGGLLLLWVPTVTVPRALTAPIGLVAGASLYIYLTHWQVFPPVRDAVGPVAALFASLAAGVLLWRATRAVEVGVRRVSAGRRAAVARGRAQGASWRG
jgi:hypothetical protein